MITYNLNLTVGNLIRIKSAGTVIELCVYVCSDILIHLRGEVFRNNRSARNTLSTCNTMLQWYFGIIGRACTEGETYQGTPKIVAVYLETNLAGNRHPTKVAFDLKTLSEVEPKLLLEFMYILLLNGTKSIAPCAKLLTEAQMGQWTEKLLSLMEDVSRLLGINPVIDGRRRIIFTSVLVRFDQPGGPDEIRDLIS